MDNAKVSVSRYECERCKHKWVPKKSNPIACPKCKRPYWDISKNLKNEMSRATF